MDGFKIYYYENNSFLNIGELYDESRVTLFLCSTNLKNIRCTGKCIEYLENNKIEELESLSK